MGGESFKRRLVHSAELTIMAENNFVLLLKSFIANFLKCKAHVLRTKFKHVRMCYNVLLSGESLLMRFYKNRNRLIKVSKCLTYLPCIQYSHNAWF